MKLVACVLAALFVGACSSSTDSPTTSTGASSSSGGPVACGGKAGTTCPSGTFCDFTPSFCGASDATGLCKPAPETCPEVYRATCGCDGKVHSNGCDANGAGVDVSLAGGCKSPGPDLFPCGDTFCDRTKEYCEESLSDIGNVDGSYACRELPATCGAMATCDCFPQSGCGSTCSGNWQAGFTLHCPAG